MPSGSKPSKPKPADVAADTKKNYIPLIKKQYGNIWNTHSYLFTEPLAQLTFTDHERCTGSPEFCLLPRNLCTAAISFANTIQLSCRVIPSTPPSTGRPKTISVSPSFAPLMTNGPAETGRPVSWATRCVAAPDPR